MHLKYYNKCEDIVSKSTEMNKITNLVSLRLFLSFLLCSPTTRGGKSQRATVFQSFNASLLQ